MGSFRKRYLAIRIKGKVYVMNDQDELGGLIDLGIEHEVLGEICDDQEFGDNCNTDCLHYRKGTCPATTLRECVRGELIHVLMEKEKLL